MIGSAGLGNSHKIHKIHLTMEGGHLMTMEGGHLMKMEGGHWKMEGGPLKMEGGH